MKFLRFFALLGILTASAAIPAYAQSTITTEREVGAPATKVETKTYIKDGKTVTERVVTTVQQEREAVFKIYKAAIFVANRAGKNYDDKVSSLEDYVTSQVTDLGISVISRETAANVVAHSDGAAANATDRALAEGSSAVRLAQMLGADYLLQVTLTSFDTAARTIDTYGVQAVNVTNTVRVIYKILDGQTGASLTADTVKVSKLVQQSQVSASAQADVLDELLADASKKVATSLKTRIDAGRITAPTAPTFANVTINIVTAEAATLKRPHEVSHTQAPSEFSVYVDGLSVGTGPGPIKIRPGLSHIRVVHPDYEPWESQVNVTDGQTITVTVRRSGASRTEEQAMAVAATGLGFLDKHLGRAMIIGAIILVSFALAFALRARRRYLASGSTEISVKNTHT